MGALIREFRLLDVTRAVLLFAASIATVTYCSGSFDLFPSVLACVAIIASLVYFNKFACRDFAFPSVVGRACCLVISLVFSFVLVLGAHIRVTDPVIAGGIYENYIEPYSAIDFVAFWVMSALVFWVLSVLVQLSCRYRCCVFCKDSLRANDGDSSIRLLSVAVRALVIFLLYLPFFLRYCPGLFFWGHLLVVCSDYGVEPFEQPSSGCIHHDDGCLYQNCWAYGDESFGGRCLANGASDGLCCLHVWLSFNLGDFPLGGLLSLVLAACSLFWLVAVLRSIFCGALERPVVFLLSCLDGDHACRCRHGKGFPVERVAFARFWCPGVGRYASTE